MTNKTRDRKYTASLPLGGLRDGVLTTVTFKLLSLQVCLSYAVWLWFREKVTGRQGWQVGWKRGRLFDHLMHGSRSCAAGQWVMVGKGLKWPVFGRNFKKAPRVGESCAAGMRIIQQWLSWENNYASDLCWDLCGLENQTFERCLSCRCRLPPRISCDKQTCPLDLKFT